MATKERFQWSEIKKGSPYFLVSRQIGTADQDS